MPTCNQDEVIDKLNKYLKSRRRKLKLPYGYCHGFTLLWLYKMSEGQEKWFYDTIKKIVAHKDKNFEDIEMDIEKFLNHIEWLQNSSKYIPAIRQLDVHQLLETRRDFSLSYIFNSLEFSNALNDVVLKNKMVCLSGPTHTIGVFKRGSKYFIFDPNFDEGEPKQFESINELQTEIVKSLFIEFKLPTNRLPVTINIADEKPGKYKVCKTGMFKQLAHTSKKSNVIGPEGLTPLYVACESGDEEEVSILLKKKVAINHKVKDGSTALYIAAQNGYTNIVRRLLNENADPNLTSNDLCSPLKAASESGHNELVKLLLEAKANIEEADENNATSLEAAADNNHTNVVKTLLEAGASLTNHSSTGIPALRYAIRNRNWEMTVCILEHIDKASKLASEDKKLLRRNKKRIKEMIEYRRNSEPNFAIKNSDLLLVLQCIVPSPASVKEGQENRFTSNSKKRKANDLIEVREPPLFNKRFCRNR